MWTDAHCHLNPSAFDGDDGVDATIARARAAGVTRMVTIGAGYGVMGMQAACAVANRHPDVWFTVGVHPHDAKDWDRAVIAQIEALAAHPRCVAIGEMGLDFHYDLSERDTQRRCLTEQVALARRLAKPIVIHDRESDNETLAMLEALGAFEVGVVFHCFAGDVDDMRRVVDLGGYVSIPGIVTFKKPGHLLDVAAAVPADRYMVETDSPYLAPIPHRGRRNEPAYVVRTGEAVARARGVAPELVAAESAANAARFFGLT